MTTNPRDLRLRKREMFRMLGYEPHAGQLLVHRSTARRRVLACGVRWGKSMCASMEAVAALLEPRPAALGWLVAPTYDLTNRIFNRVTAIVQGHFRHRVVEYVRREHRIVVCNGAGGVSELRAKSADRPESLLGESLDFLVVDEGASIREGIWDECLAPRLIDRNGWALIVSTPHGRGWFYAQFRLGQRGRDPGYESWQAPTSQNPTIDVRIIEAERGRLDEETFKEQYEAQFSGPRERCDTCGGPSPDVTGTMVLFDDDALLRCPECGEGVDRFGKTIVADWGDGVPQMKLVRFVDVTDFVLRMKLYHDWGPQRNKDRDYHWDPSNPFNPPLSALPVLPSRADPTLRERVHAGRVPAATDTA
jgi:hypothetical protein